MKKVIPTLIAAALMACVLTGCAFLMGPDNGGGNLRISFGGGPGRAITSVENIPQEVFEALNYRVALTGPGEVPEQSVRHGGLLELTLPLGMWQLEVRAYKDGGLAGTSNQSIRVAPGLTVIDVPMELNQGYFSISIDHASMSKGTVETAAQAAFPEATIRLTPVPDEGYALKAGSLRVNNGAVPVTGSGTEYSFVMPAADVTISAEFNQLLGIAIEGPEDEAITVSAVNSRTGDDSSLEISWAGDETLTFTLDSNDYKAEEGALKWMMDGADLTPGSGSSILIRARDYLMKTYTLTVMIKKNDQWYSTDIDFTVVSGQ
jgi:hypothetical protein